MKIIAYAHPPVMAEGASFNIGWAYVLLDILRPLCASNADVHAALVVGARFAKTIATPPLPANLSLIVIDEIALHQDLFAEGYRLGKVSSVMMQERWDDPAAAILTRHIAAAAKQANWHMTPDVILSFAVKAGFLNRLWPAAPVFHIEMGPFSRAPFPRSIFMDHAGIYDSASIARHATQGGPWPVSESGAVLARDLRAAYTAQVEAINPFRHHDYRRRFAKLCLLPLQVSGNFTFDDQAPYRTQLEYVADILAATPKDVGLVVTEYNHWVSYLDTQAPSRSLDFLKRHPSFLYPLKSRGMTSPSLFLAPMVDGVWSVSSNVGYLGLFFGKWLGAASKHLAPVAACKDPASLMAHLDQPAPSQDALIGWMLERYYIPASLYTDPQWMLEYLQRRLEACRKPELAAAYPPLASTDKLRTAWQPQPPAPAYERAFFASDLWARTALAGEQRQKRQAQPVSQSRIDALRTLWKATREQNASAHQVGVGGYILLNPTPSADYPASSVATAFIHDKISALNLSCYGSAADRNELERLEYAPNYPDVRLIVLNGEGLESGDRQNALDLLDFCGRARAAGKRVVLVNGVFLGGEDAIGARLCHFDIVAARDAQSHRALLRWCPEAHMVPDIAFAAYAEEARQIRDRRAASPNKAEDSWVVLDSAATAPSDDLLDFARFHDMPFLVSDTRHETRYLAPEWLYQLEGQYFPRALERVGDLTPYSCGITGHADSLIALLLCRIAPLVWTGGNRGIKALLEDMGLADRIALPESWLSSGYNERKDVAVAMLSLWDDGAWQKVDAYAAAAHDKVRTLFDAIAALVAIPAEDKTTLPAMGTDGDVQRLYDHIERQRRVLLQLNDHISRIYASRSWRLTHGLRATHTMVRRVMRLLDMILAALRAKRRRP